MGASLGRNRVARFGVFSVERKRTGVGDVEDDANAVVSGWWHDTELAPCPRCGNRRLTPPSPSLSGMRICLTCGVVDEIEAP
jgi:hypothetical protein